MHTKTSPFPLFRLHHQLSSSLHHPLLRYVTALMVTSFSMLLLLSLPWAVLLKAFSIWKTLTGADGGSSDSLLSSLALRLNTTMQRQHGRQRQWTWHRAVSSKEVCVSIKGGPNCKSYFFFYCFQLQTNLVWTLSHFALPPQKLQGNNFFHKIEPNVFAALQHWAVLPPHHHHFAYMDTYLLYFYCLDFHHCCFCLSHRLHIPIWIHTFTLQYVA